MTTLTIPSTRDWIAMKAFYEAERGTQNRNLPYTVKTIYPHVGEVSERFVAVERKGVVTGRIYNELLICSESDLWFSEGSSIQVKGERFEIGDQLIIRALRVSDRDSHICNCNRCHL